MESASAVHFSLPVELPDTWLERYGLRQNPFHSDAWSADSDYLTAGAWYSGAQRGWLLEQVDHSCRYSSGVTVVAGGSGSGRSLMCHQLHQMLAPEARVSCLQAELLSSVEQVLQGIARDLHCVVGNDASAGEIMASLRHQLREQGDALQVVLIDDAQLLADNLLGGLLSLLADADSSGHLHLVLFGDDDLIERLDSYAPVEVMLQDLALPPLDEQEAVEYLQFKWEQAGAEQALPLTVAQMQRLWQRSQGMPGALERLAESALVQMSAESESRSGLPIAHLFALVALVSFLLVAFFYRDNWFASDDEGEPRVVLPVRPVPMPEPVVPPHAVLQPEATASGRLPVSVTPPAAVEPVRQAAPPQGLSQSEAVVVPASGSQAVVIEPPPAPVAAPEVAVPAPAAVPQIAQPEIVLPEPPVVPGPRAVAGTPEQALLALPSTSFVVQVMAAGSRESVVEFIARQSNRGQLQMYQTQRNGKPWLVVVISGFADRQQAKQALAGLPAEQRKAGAWVRPAADVQADIRQNPDR